MSRPRRDPEFPAVILIDSREQIPFSFAGIAADREQGGGTWRVRTEVRGIPSGDYTLDGYADRIAVERKSVADLFGTVSQGRQRFVRELERLAAFDYAAVVIEGDWTEITTSPPRRSKLPPRIVYRSVVAWQQRYPRVHWWPCPTREFAELTTFRILERFLKEQQPCTAGANRPGRNPSTSSTTAGRCAGSGG